MNVYMCAGEKGGEKQGEDFIKLSNTKHERGKAIFSKPKQTVSTSEHTCE